MSSASFSLLEGDPTTWGVPAVGKTFFGINLSGQPVTVNNDGSGGAIISPIVVSAPAGLPFANSSGTSTLTPTAGLTTAVGIISGSARNVPIVLATANMTDGMVLDMLLEFPALDSLVMNIYNTVGSGSPITSVPSTTAGGITTAYLRFLFQSSTGLWLLITGKSPA